jgi:Galactose oxidase, central domain
MRAIFGSPALCAVLAAVAVLVLLLPSAAASTDQLHGSTQTAPSLSGGGQSAAKLLTVAPSARMGLSMAYDPAVKGIILFGGQLNYTSPGTNASNQTWKFENGKWTLLHPKNSPPARTEASLGYDAKDGYLVLFGGFTGANRTRLNDTWEFSNGTWTNVTRAHSPSVRFDAGMTYDVRDGYLLLFGGRYNCLLAGTCELGDTWKFVGGTWTQIGSCGGVNQPSCGRLAPSPRASPAMAYNGTNGSSKVFLQGGYLGYTGQPSDYANDTWSYARGVWTNLTSKLSPPGPRSVGTGLAMSLTTKGPRLLLFGGETAAGPAGTNITWRLVPGRWVNLTSSLVVLPPERAYFGMCWDPAVSKVILFGGESNVGNTANIALLNDTWAWSAGHWTQL